MKFLNSVLLLLWLIPAVSWAAELSISSISSQPTVADGFSSVTDSFLTLRPKNHLDEQKVKISPESCYLASPKYSLTEDISFGYYFLKRSDGKYEVKWYYDYEKAFSLQLFKIKFRHNDDHFNNLLHSTAKDGFFYSWHTDSWTELTQQDFEISFKKHKHEEVVFSTSCNGKENCTPIGFPDRAPCDYEKSLLLPTIIVTSTVVEPVPDSTPSLSASISTPTSTSTSSLLLSTTSSEQHSTTQSDSKLQGSETKPTNHKTQVEPTFSLTSNYPNPSYVYVTLSLSKEHQKLSVISNESSKRTISWASRLSQTSLSAINSNTSTSSDSVTYSATHYTFTTANISTSAYSSRFTASSSFLRNITQTTKLFANFTTKTSTEYTPSTSPSTSSSNLESSPISQSLTSFSLVTTTTVSGTITSYSATCPFKNRTCSSHSFGVITETISGTATSYTTTCPLSGISEDINYSYKGDFGYDNFVKTDNVTRLVTETSCPGGCQNNIMTTATPTKNSLDSFHLTKLPFANNTLSYNDELLGFDNSTMFFQVSSSYGDNSLKITNLNPETLSSSGRKKPVSASTLSAFAQNTESKINFSNTYSGVGSYLRVKLPLFCAIAGLLLL